MEVLVILVVAALSVSLAVAGAAAVLWSALSLMAAMQPRTTASLPACAVAEEMPIAARLAARRALTNC
jgi:hypothetical protein